MRLSAVVGAIILAPAALAAPATPASGEGFLDLRDDALAAESIIQADLLAVAAAVNQQLYQAKERPTQWKKCNTKTAVHRREW